MEPLVLVIIAIAALGGAGLGWFLGSRAATQALADRDAAARERDRVRAESEDWRGKFNEAIVNLAAERRTAERVESLDTELRQERGKVAQLSGQLAAFERGELERQRAHDQQLAQLKEMEAKLEARFAELAGKAVEGAHDVFLKRAEERLGQAGDLHQEKLKTLLQPVETTLKRYEEGLAQVEKERVGSYRELREAIEQVRSGQNEVKSEAAKLVNALRAAPKTRGRWGEQQFKNLIEIAGLSGFVDFQEEVTVGTDDGNLRPDFVIRLPGDQQLVVDVKCSLEAYLQAAEADDPDRRRTCLDDHARAVRGHAEALAKKSYWDQFARAPDFVIMYVPGDNFIGAALEADLELWERAARKRVIICGPSTFLPMARTVAGIWRQEKLAQEAKQIGALGKEMYDRLAVVAAKLKTVGSGLGTAVRNYNEFVSSFESRVMVTGRRFRDLNVETGAREIEEVPHVEALPRYGDLDPAALLVEPISPPDGEPAA
ncbi:MAG: DNA recombination protein RmuC [Alphaproteobacteria bacterium]|nr:DNA recombination protein RmuC [Alphaproteobacteria bacterium]